MLGQLLWIALFIYVCLGVMSVGVRIMAVGMG